MKNLLSVFLMTFLVACGAPAPEGENPEATDDPLLETADAEDPDEEGDEEEIEIPPEGALPLSTIIRGLEAMDSSRPSSRTACGRSNTSSMVRSVSSSSIQ